MDFVLIYVAFLGLVVGSFLNALVWRVKTERSIVHGRSMCPDCSHQLAAKDLLPIASWLTLRGKCRYCGHKISLQYPLVEAVTAILFILSYLALRPTEAILWVDFVVWLILLAGLIFLAVFDLRWLLLPDKVLLPMIALALLWLVISSLWLGTPMAMADHLLSGLAVGLVFYALATVAGGKLMGGGDVKLGFFMGLALGISGTLVALFLAFNMAAIVGVTLILLGLKTRKDYIPFGPFLVAGTIIAYLYGQQLVSWYLSITVLA